MEKYMKQHMNSYFRMPKNTALFKKHLQNGYTKNCTVVRIKLSQGGTAWL